MDFTVELGNKYGVMPFEILKQDKDHVILLINYYIEKGRSTEGRADVDTGATYGTTEKEQDRAFWAAL